MTAQQFTAVLEDFSELESIPASSLRLLLDTYPYCANLYLLHTYKLHETGSAAYIKSLEMAALQTLDRSLLADNIRSLSDFLQAKQQAPREESFSDTSATIQEDSHLEAIGKPLSWHTGSESLLEKMLGQADYYTLDQSQIGLLASIAALPDFLPTGGTPQTFRPKKKISGREKKAGPHHDATSAQNPPATRYPDEDSGDELHLAAEKSIEEPLSLASETLAKILVKQGQTEKAIEMYKRLILIFPEKKAYFASAIEQLKKQ